MKYPDFIEDIIISKAYAELTSEEKEKVAEFIGSEDEYTTVRSFLISMEKTVGEVETPLPSATAKDKLMASFDTKYTRKKPLLVSRRTMAVISVAASLTLLVAVIWWWQTSNPVSPGQVAENQDSKAVIPAPTGEMDKEIVPETKEKTQSGTVELAENSSETQTVNSSDAASAPAKQKATISEADDTIPESVDSKTPISASLAMYDDLAEMTVTIF